MSVQLDGHRTSKVVRMQSTPDYIPTITSNVLVHTNSAHIGDNDAEQKQWGRIKNVAQIQREDYSEISDDSDSPRRSVGIEHFQRTAKLIIRSRNAIKRVRTKAANLLTRTNSRLSLASIVDLGPKIEDEMFDNYSLAEMYKQVRKRKHLKLATLQKKFLNDLPELKTVSVKERLAQKIEILEKIKQSDYVTDPLPTNEKVDKVPTENPSRRQSRLRKSLDITGCRIYNRTSEALQSDNSDDPIMSTPLTVADVDVELAVSRNREKLESDLNLPNDRMARFAVLKSNIEKINFKFHSLVKGKKVDADGTAIDQLNDEELYYAPSRFTSNGMAKEYFRKYARLVHIVTQWINMIMNKQNDFEKELKSFVDIANEIDNTAMSSSMQEFGLSFDKKLFKANKEISLSAEVRKILTTRWQSRTTKMIKQVMNGLQSLRSLSEYPQQTQEKLCKVAWYQTIGPKKLIVRQGHHAESFYFILSGMAFVKKMVQDPVTGESKAQVAARLTKGHSFGEIGLLFDTLRTATVESATPMELLVIGKEDFVRIFMKAENPDDEPDHIKFLKKIPFMASWPMDTLKLEPGACLTHYFKRGTLITDNDRHSEWIYIVMSGACEVLKRLKAVKGRPHREMRLKSDPMSDIILPELGMPNNHAKIDSGKLRRNKSLIHPEVFRNMTNYYDSLRRKYENETPQTPAEKKEMPPVEDESLMELPDQADKQLSKVFSRSVSARRFSNASIAHVPKVRFADEKQKTDGDIRSKEFKIVPLAPGNSRRPVSRAKLDESTPKLKRDHFRLPSREKLEASYRPTSIDSDVFLASTKAAEDVFVKVEVLHPKDCFGLNTLKHVMETDDEVFDVGGEETPILSLVSRGAEVILISKKVFLKYADQKCKLRVRDQIKVYPSEEVMQGNMQREADWSLYKESLLAKYIEKKVKKEHPRSKSNMF